MPRRTHGVAPAATAGLGAVWAYFALAYAFAWAWWTPLALAHRGVISLPWTTHVPGLVGPLLAAMIVTAVVDGRAGVADLSRRMLRWRVGMRGVALALAPLALLGVAVVIAGPFAGRPAWSDLGRFDGIADIGPVGVLVVLIVVNGLGEETGWRGFAHDRLARRWGFRRSVMVVAVLWAGWHAPLFLFHEGFRQIPPPLIAGWLIGILAGAIVLASTYDDARRSILVVAIWHGSYNWAVATDAGDGAIGAIVTAVVIAAAIVIVRSGRADRGPAPEGRATARPLRAPDRAG